MINVGEIETECFNIQNNVVNIHCNYAVDFYHKMIYEKAIDYNFLDGIKIKGLSSYFYFIIFFYAPFTFRQRNQTNYIIGKMQ